MRKTASDASEPLSQPLNRPVPADYLAAFLAASASLAVYIRTLAPTVTGEDSGEFITAAWSLGIPHPPGYPLWLILAKLFSFLPIGTVAYRLNLMSAILDAAAVGLLALVISRTFPRVCARVISQPSTGSA